jgi:hypothetical protein
VFARPHGPSNPGLVRNVARTAKPKVSATRSPPTRDREPSQVSEQVKACQRTADPVISVDTKKKELVGEFSNPGRQS